MMRETPSQTAGPYVHIGSNPNWVEITGVWDRDLGLVMVGSETPGERILLAGTIFDGAGAPVTDALVEIWQADAAGFHNDRAGASFTGWGRQPVDAQTGAFRFETIKPGRVPDHSGTLMAPHVSIWIVARGLNVGLHTRLYFEDAAEANAADPLLARVPPARRPTLIARRDTQDDMPRYTLDIHLQGPRETVFLDI